ncbi:zinc-dependent peptidase [Comamonas antarctica]|uniref:Zinc-dependent peptidase n=1 Tax=Comamonas antarctica TaxID=2743470 RepID=A0A6N1X3E2_9BURK|nr:M90 family metallopeptidase [Comamonas antarctica]QKV52552.1 zinc-dependent peptidase [Comamonas antarctica]
MTLGQLWRQLQRRFSPLPEIDAGLWLATMQAYPFLSALALADQAKLRALAALFLQRKQFHGAHGLEVTDTIAVHIAAQACLPLLHWGTPREALAWYDDFVGIVVHPGEAVARREAVDEAGVVHYYKEVLLGEAMEGGPVMLSWQAVDENRHSAAAGTNVVIHEFAHKIDMRNGTADGCPPLPNGFLGSASTRAARALWHAAWEPAYQQFREQVIIAERFGGAWPWLDSYGATAPPEFFAVACEAWFVNRTQFTQDFPTLAPQLEALFGTGRAA